MRALRHALCPLRVSSGAADRKNLPHRVPRSIALLLVARSSWRRSGKSWASLGGLKEKISRSSTGLLSKRTTAYPSLRRTWFVSRLI